MPVTGNYIALDAVDKIDITRKIAEVGYKRWKNGVGLASTTLPKRRRALEVRRGGPR